MMMNKKPEPLDFQEVREILGTLAKILADGLDAEQREQVLTDALQKKALEKAKDELGIFKALFSLYEQQEDLEFVLDINERIRGTQSFFRDVGKEVDRLNYLIKENGLRHKLMQTKPYVFVLIPFQPELLEVYEEVIRPTLEKLGCQVKYADELPTVNNIIDDIYTQIIRSDFLIADTTGQSANVFYEIGFAHGQGKTVILLAQDTKDIPFDVRSLRHIIYNPRSPNRLRRKLHDTAEQLINEIRNT